MKICYSLLSLYFVFVSGSIWGQTAGYHFGMKGGVSLANQSWNENDRRMLFTYHGNLFIESRDPDDRGALYAQIGMHTRGSSIGITTFRRNDLNYQFQNLSFQLGAKKKVPSNLGAQPYYFVGIRGEYTVGDNLLEIGERRLEISNVNPNFPLDIQDPIHIRKLNYGITLGGGFEFIGGEFFTPAIEFNISPDLSFQYDRPQIENTTAGILPATQVRNITFEISLVMKFLREVIYE